MKQLFCCKPSDEEDAHLNKKALESLENLSLESVEKLPLTTEIPIENQSDDELPVLNIFPIGKSGYLGKLNLTKNQFNRLATRSEFETIVILDSSGSMGDWVPRMVQKIIPKMLLKLGYAESDSITILAFEYICRKYIYKMQDMPKSLLRASGGTHMEPAVVALKEELSNIIKTGKGVRILTISDGEVSDRRDCKNAADLLTREFKNQLRINSQAVQLFSSYSANPDTVALCSLLQLNNTTSSQVININNNFEDNAIISEMAKPFQGDGLGTTLNIETGSNIFKKNLWDPEFSGNVTLQLGENCFWINPECVADVVNGKIELKLGASASALEIELKGEKTDVEDVTNLFGHQLQQVYEYLKVLRIINSESSKLMNQSIIQQYRDLEAQLTHRDLNVLANGDMSSRIVYLRNELRKRRAGFVMKMSQIANDDTIDRLNSAQKAEYLRSTEHSKNSRGLARRAAIGGFDFDGIAREEARAIAQHLNELTVDDSQHQSSFYSMETTLGGLRAVADMTKMPDFEETTANDILLLLNVVGIACDGPVGDFPDPMTWRVNKIFPGVFVSISDILTSKIQSGQPERKLTVPGHNCHLNNAIPVFEDQSIAVFYRKYAPNLLSYTCSIGMRGMIAHVPMTDGYTMCAGIWKLVEHVAKNPTELNISTFDHLCKTYELFAGNYFKDSRNCLLAEPPIMLSFYLQNNGLTNMISPIYHQCTSPQNYPKLKKNSAAILRALFSYEIWQVFRREFKGADSSEKINEMLHKLLGINLDRDAVPLAPLFEKETPYNQICFPETPHYNFAYLKEFLDANGWYLKYVSIIILLIEHVARGTLDQIKVAPTLGECVNDEYFLKAQFGLPADYNYQEFLMYSAVQSLLYPRTNDRVDQGHNRMFIADLINPKSIQELIKKYISDQFKSRYDSDSVARRKLENTELREKFIDSVCKCQDRQELIDLFKKGVRIGEHEFTYVGLNSLAFIELKQAILDTSKYFPLRKDVIKIFMLACDMENNFEPLYNNGKSCPISNMEEFKNVFINVSGGSIKEWNDLFDEYKARIIHSYRYLANRHGHHNDKPSYWALGYMTLEAFAKDHTPQQFEEYCRIHHDCCGVNQLG